MPPTLTDISTWTERTGHDRLRSFKGDDGNVWIAQNPTRRTKWAKLAREGHSVDLWESNDYTSAMEKHSSSHIALSGEIRSHFNVSPVIPPPSLSYPYAKQISLQSQHGVLRSTWDPTVGLPADQWSVLTLLKTNANPLMHGDTVQIQGNASAFSGWLLRNLDQLLPIAGLGTVRQLSMWPYTQGGIITDPDSLFAIYRADGLNQAIVGQTDVRLLASDGTFVQQNTQLGPGAGQGQTLLFTGGLVSADTIFTFVEIP